MIPPCATRLFAVQKEKLLPEKRKGLLQDSVILAAVCPGKKKEEKKPHLVRKGFNT